MDGTHTYKEFEKVDWSFIWDKLVELGDTGCWEWTGMLTERQYPINPEIPENRAGHDIHRLVYWMINKKYVRGGKIVQTCGNIRCTNPSHFHFQRRNK